MAKKLTELQYAAIAILALPKRGGLKLEEVAEKVGVHRATLHEWRNRDDFNEELKRQIVRNTLDDMPEIMASLKDHITESGNAAMLRTLLQAHGMLTEKHEVETKQGEALDMDDVHAKIERHRRIEGE